MLVDVRLNKKKTSTRTLFFSSLTTKQSLICECTRRLQSSFSRIFAVIVCILMMLTQMTTIFEIKRLNEIVYCFAYFLANASTCRRRLSYCKLFSSITAYTSEFFSNISSSQATIVEKTRNPSLGPRIVGGPRQARGRVTWPQLCSGQAPKAIIYLYIGPYGPYCS